MISTATEIGGFTVAQVGTHGCEVRDPEGVVIAWTVNRGWAMAIAGLLEAALVDGELRHP